MIEFLKLPEELRISLERDEITSFLPAQEQLFKKIKEGKNLLVHQQPQVGVSKLLAWASIFKVPSPEEGSPRAIILCSTDDKAKELHEEIKIRSKRMDLTVDLAHEKGNQLQQRNDIFDGTELVVATPKRLYDLYIQNGVNLNLLRYFAIDDAEKVFTGNNLGYMIRLADSLPRCQVILTYHQPSPKIDHFVNEGSFNFVRIKL